MSRATATEPSVAALPILPHPNLLFDREELESIKAKRTDPRAEALFQQIVARCNQFMDPASDEFRDWETLKDPRWGLREGMKLAVAPIEPCAFVYAMTGERKYAELARN